MEPMAHFRKAIIRTHVKEFEGVSRDKDSEAPLLPSDNLSFGMGEEQPGNLTK